MISSKVGSLARWDHNEELTQSMSYWSQLASGSVGLICLRKVALHRGSLSLCVTHTHTHTHTHTNIWEGKSPPLKDSDVVKEGGTLGLNMQSQLTSNAQESSYAL